MAAHRPAPGWPARFHVLRRPPRADRPLRDLRVCVTRALRGPLR